MSLEKRNRFKGFIGFIGDLAAAVTIDVSNMQEVILCRSNSFSEAFDIRAVGSATDVPSNPGFFLVRSLDKVFTDINILREMAA